MPAPVPPHSPPRPAVAAVPAAPALPISTGGGQHQVVVRYYRRMKPQRVYRLTVELRSLAKKGTPSTAPPGDAVRVRPQVPGCFISPPELEVSPKASANRATFYVTPLAKGRLRDAQVGVFHQGHMLQQVNLRMKSVTQCLTRWLLFLTVAAPLFVWWTTSYLDLSGMGPAPKKAGEIKQEERPKLPDDAALGADMPADAKEDEAEPKEAKPKPKPKVQGPLAKTIIKYVPEYPGTTYAHQTAEKAQEGYNNLRTLQQKNHLSFWVCVSFLGLTLLSLVTHRQARGKRKGKPLTLPAAATTPDFGGSDALSFNIPVHPMR